MTESAIASRWDIFWKKEQRQGFLPYLYAKLCAIFAFMFICLELLIDLFQREVCTTPTQVNVNYNKLWML